MPLKKILLSYFFLVSAPILHSQSLQPLFFTFKDSAFHIGQRKVLILGWSCYFDSVANYTAMTMDSIKLFLYQHPNIKIEIGGNTDDEGRAEYNVRLSKNRADTMRRYLIFKGIPEEQLISRGYGEVTPLVPNKNPDGSDNAINKQMNRRMELKIISVNENFDFSDSVFHIGQTKILTEVYFNYSQSTLRPEAHVTLDSLCDFLLKNKKMGIEILCYSGGTHDVPLSLFQARADTVKNQLLRCGIEPERLQAKGYMKSKRYLNEANQLPYVRTEIKVLSVK